MKVNNEEFIALCATHGIEGIDIVNELMRFKVLKTIGITSMRIKSMKPPPTRENHFV